MSNVELGEGKLDQLGADEATPDLDLPAGSACVQIILHKDQIDVRTVLIGATSVDVNNPAHRLAGALNQQIPMLMELIAGVPVRAMAQDEFRDRLGANAHGIGPDTDPDNQAKPPEDTGTAEQALDRQVEGTLAHVAAQQLEAGEAAAMAGGSVEDVKRAMMLAGEAAAISRLPAELRKHDA